MRKNLGIYVHIPFCAGKCAYCDFYSLAGHDDLMPRYQKAVLEHIKESSPQLRTFDIDSVYFGGGTPSYYGAPNIVEIFDALKKYGTVFRDAEVTVEVNPDSATLPVLTKLRRAGVNRLSIGVQSANDGILKSLGRLHNFEQAEQTVSNARRAGFENVSIDLIYGLPSQTREDLAATITKAAALDPEHISYYGLKIEPGTPLYEYRDSPFIPDDDTQADMYLFGVEMLGRYGYRQYEISNFAKRGFESRHNLKYWKCEDYIGFGAAAHSCVGLTRYSNVSDIEKYSDSILNGGTVVDYLERITDFERAGEYLMLGLRTTEGICEDEYRQIYPCDFSPIREKLEFCVKNGWAVNSNDRWSFTPKGFLISNTLIGDILDAQTAQRYDVKAQIIPSSDDPQIGLFESERNMHIFNGLT